MNSRALRLLGAVAIVIIIAAVLVSRSRRPDNVEQASLFPTLKGKLDSVTGISIYKSGDQLAVDIAHDGDTWKVKQRGAYPADQNKVRTLLLNLEDAKLREQKTANASNYATLNVQDVSDPATSGVRVELVGPQPDAKLIVGKHDSAAHSTFVRRAGEAQSWLIGTELDVSSDPLQWLKRDFVNIGADRVQQVDVEIAGSPKYSAVKNTKADANFDVKPLPKSRELSSVAVANGAAQSLTSLQLDDVRPASEIAGQKATAHTSFRTFDGLVVECIGYTDGDKRWLTLKANFDSELAKRFHVAPAVEKKDAAPERKDDKEPKAPSENPAEATDKKIQDEAASLNSNVGSWAFAVPTYKYDAIFKPLDDLLKKPEMLKKSDATKLPSILEKK